MKLLMSLLLLSSTLCFAADTVPAAYRDGTLVSSNMAAGRDRCNCTDTRRGEYVVSSEGIVYQLTPVSGATSTFLQKATLGLGKGFTGFSSLYHQPPGTALQLRDEGRRVFVKVGHRETMYSAIEVREQAAVIAQKP